MSKKNTLIELEHQKNVLYLNREDYYNSIERQIRDLQKTIDEIKTKELKADISIRKELRIKYEPIIEWLSYDNLEQMKKDVENRHTRIDYYINKIITNVVITIGDVEREIFVDEENKELDLVRRGYYHYNLFDTEEEAKDFLFEVLEKRIKDHEERKQKNEQEK